MRKAKAIMWVAGMLLAILYMVRCNMAMTP